MWRRISLSSSIAAAAKSSTARSVLWAAPALSLRSSKIIIISNANEEVINILPFPSPSLQTQLRFLSQFPSPNLPPSAQKGEEEESETQSLLSGNGDWDGDDHIDPFAPPSPPPPHLHDTTSPLSEHFTGGGGGGGGDFAAAVVSREQEESDAEQGEPSCDIDTEKLQTVLSLLQGTVDGSLESTLNAMNLDLHEQFLLQVLQTPLILGHNLIRFFNWATKKPDVSVTTPLVAALVRAITTYLRKKDADALWDLVKEVGHKDNSLLNVDILNRLIALFSKLGQGKAALEVFQKFGDFECAPNSDTYYYTIEALCRRSCFDWAGTVCEKMLNAEALPDGHNVGKIISWFCKGGKAKDAFAVYVLAKQQNKSLPLSSVKFLVLSLCRKDETVRLALDMLGDFIGEARKYAIKPFSSVVHGLCRIKDVDGAKSLLSSMIAEGPPPGNAVFNNIISAHSKGGDMKEAVDTMKLMESRGLKPDVFTYTVIMSGYASGGQMEEARKMLSAAKKKHSKLNSVTYHTLIRGYCKVEQFDKALELLAEMKQFGVSPTVDEYNKLIQTLCLKSVDWETAEKLLTEMKENGLHLNGITKGLIRAVKELEEGGLQEVS